MLLDCTSVHNVDHPASRSLCDCTSVHNVDHPASMSLCENLCCELHNVLVGSFVGCKCSLNLHLRQPSIKIGRFCPVAPAGYYEAACKVNKIAYMYALSAGTSVQAGSRQCDLLHHGASIHSAGVALVRVIVNSFLWHIVGLAHLRCL